MPTIHRSVLGSAALTASLPFFLEDPKRFWWLALVIGAGVILVVDDTLFHLTNGKITIILFCFDCDLTLEVSNGPIPISLLYELMNQGHYVCVVSPSLRCFNLKGILRYAPLLPRDMILSRIKQFIQADRYIYVGDSQGDYLAANKAAWEFVAAQNFVKWLSG